MDQFYKNLFAHFFLTLRWVIFIFLVFFCMARYCYWYIYETDENLLSDAYLIKEAKENILGKKPHTQTCPAVFYQDDVKYLHDVRKNHEGNNILSPTAEFKFNPKPGYEKKCPSVVLSMERRMGETWITDSPK